MKKIVKVLCLGAMLIGMGTSAQAQFRQGIYLNGNIPTGDFNNDVSATHTTVPLTYTEIGKDATIGFGFGYRVSYRFDVGVGDVAPFANVDFLWNTISGKWSDQYSDAYMSSPTYFNIPIMAGVSYIYDELPWSDIKIFGEFGIGTDLFWITSEGGTTTVVPPAGSTYTVNNEYSYKPTFAFAFSIGAGAFFGEHVSAGLYYYGLGTHNIDYTQGTLDEHPANDPYTPLVTPLPRQRRDIGSLMLRIGFHF